MGNRTMAVIFRCAYFLQILVSGAKRKSLRERARDFGVSLILGSDVLQDVHVRTAYQHGPRHILHLHLGTSYQLTQSAILYIHLRTSYQRPG